MSAVSALGPSDAEFVAVSGTGNATACAAFDPCVAVSGTGHASGHTAGVSACDIAASHGVATLCTQ